MSLKRRNTIAFILILLSAVCWTFGQQMLDTNAEGDITATTYPGIVETMYPTDNTTVGSNEEWSVPTSPTNTSPTESEPLESDRKDDSRSERMLGMILSFAAVIAGIIAIFVLSQKNAILGPDGICLSLALLTAAYHISLNMDYILWGSTIQTLTRLSEIVCAFVVLLCIRVLFGWMKVRFSLSWCLVQRIAQRCTAPQISLLVFVAWIMLPLAGLAWFRGSNVYEVFWICVVGFVATSAFGFLCLWKYGKDLSHFQKQLNNYQNGKPITVGDGAFAQTEAQLLDVQAQHEEAVRTAVTSERFKVELISNASHDLRTPLTSILGYSYTKCKIQITEHLDSYLKEMDSVIGSEAYQQFLAGHLCNIIDLYSVYAVHFARAMEKTDQVATDEGLKESLMRYAIESGAIVERVYQQEMNPIIEDMKRYMDGLLHIYDYGKGGRITSQLFKLPLEARDRLNEQND